MSYASPAIRFASSATMTDSACRDHGVATAFLGRAVAEGQSKLAGQPPLVQFVVAADDQWPNHIVAVFDPARFGSAQLRAKTGPAEWVANWVDPDPLPRVTAFGLNFGWAPAVSRTVAELYATCDIERAADRLGISVHTARERLEAARTSIGLPNVPMLFMLINVMAMEITQSGPESDRFLAELFDLTERQHRIASRIANGSSRQSVAEEFGLSLAVVKKELGDVFAATGVGNVLQLSRLFSEARMLAMATHYAADFPQNPPPVSRDQRLTTHEGRTLALSDYGPSSGKPVFVLHSSLTSRPVNRQLVEALQNAGFRPISIDRPGYGETDPFKDAVAGEHDPFATAAADMVEACKLIGLARIDVVTRGAAQVVVALHRMAPDLIRKAVLTNPDPDLASSTMRQGRIGAMKTAFLKRPWAIRLMGKMISSLTTYDRMADTLRRSVEACPPDRRVLDDEDNIREFYRGIVSMSEGKIAGYVNEQVAFATQAKPDPLPGSRAFSVLIGAVDFMHHPHETLAYWREVLPEARFRLVEEAGRFLTYSHAEQVVAELKHR